MWIHFDGIVNARELGGLAAADGKHVKSGRLIRAAGLHGASDRDLTRLQEEFDLREVIDFRFADECEHKPDRPVPGATYRNIPALQPSPRGNRPMFEAAEPDFDAIYRMVYAKLAESDYSAAAYRQFFDVLLAHPEGGIYYHCSQGKDRTGMASVLVLTALGVDWADIEADYFLSNVGLECMVEMADDPRASKWSRFTKEHMTYVFGANLKVYTDCVEQGWGDLSRYLRERIGLTEAEIAQLRRDYLE